MVEQKEMIFERKVENLVESDSLIPASTPSIPCEEASDLPKPVKGKGT